MPGGVADADVRRITVPTSPPEVIESEFVGELRTVNEYPTPETVDRLYDQLDFQRACQAFLRNVEPRELRQALWPWTLGTGARAKWLHPRAG
jgi:hypothetical protein